MLRFAFIVTALSFLGAAVVSGYRLYAGTAFMISHIALPASAAWSGVYMIVMLGIGSFALAFRR